MKTGLVVLVVSLLALLNGAIIAQEWSATQKEVWKSVEAYNALACAGDVEGFLSYIHPDYLGWSDSDPMPQNKEAVEKWIEYTWKKNKVMVYLLNPVGIQIHGNIAFVHYYYSLIVESPEEKPGNRQGRWTDILIKQGDKWLIIGDHGGEATDD